MTPEAEQALKALREMSPSSTWTRIGSTFASRWCRVLLYAPHECAARVYPPDDRVSAWAWHVWRRNASASSLAFASGNEATQEIAQFAAESALRAAGVEVP